DLSAKGPSLVGRGTRFLPRNAHYAEAAERCKPRKKHLAWLPFLLYTAVACGAASRVRKHTERKRPMRTVWRWLAAGVLTLGLAGSAWADDKDKPAGPLDRKALDQNVYRALTEVINKGADLYNGTSDSPNDPAGCYHLWQGALMALKPLLDHQP